MFGGDGPMMQGTWYNPYNGDAFTVRDSFFEDNQYTVVATDGRVFRYDQLQNFVQSDMKLEDLKKMKLEDSKKEDKLPDSVLNLIDSENSYSDLMIPDDNIISQPKIGNLYSEQNSKHQNTISSISENPSMNYGIIEKALSKTEKPAISISLKWDKYPEKEIEMLKDIMEISEDEIIEWYMNNIAMMDVIDNFKAAIKKRILKKDKDEPNKPKEEKSSKKNSKKNL